IPHVDPPPGCTPTGGIVGITREKSELHPATSDFCPVDRTMSSTMEPTNNRTLAQLAGSAFRQYSAALHRYLVRRLPRAQDADDLSQEVFMRLLRIEGAELVRQPQNYLYGIAANVVREYLMRSDLEQRRMAYDSELVEKEGDHPFELPPDQLADQVDAVRQ